MMEKAAFSQLQVNRARDVPAIPLFPIQNRTFNFLFKNPVDCFSFSPRDLCLMMGIVHPGLVTSEVYPLMQSVRLNSVEMWGGDDSGPGTTVPTAQAWIARSLTNGNPVLLMGRVMQDVRVQGSDATSHVLLSAKGRANVILRQWFEQDDTDYLFTMSGGKNTVVQINVSYTVRLGPPQPSLSVTTTSYLDVTGRPAIGLSAIDTGNTTGSRIVCPVPVSISLTSQIPIFD